MRVCDECGRSHYGTGKYCSTCYKIRKDSGMQANARDYELGKPDKVILLPMIEIHGLCSCTWVYDFNSKLHRLKYRNMACLVMHWHRSMESNRENAA